MTDERVQAELDRVAVVLVEMRDEFRKLKAQSPREHALLWRRIEQVLATGEAKIGCAGLFDLAPQHEVFP